jgi:hypothetical protein
MLRAIVWGQPDQVAPIGEAAPAYVNRSSPHPVEDDEDVARSYCECDYDDPFEDMVGYEREAFLEEREDEKKCILSTTTVRRNSSEHEGRVEVSVVAQWERAALQITLNGVRYCVVCSLDQRDDAVRLGIRRTRPKTVLHTSMTVFDVCVPMGALDKPDTVAIRRDRSDPILGYAKIEEPDRKISAALELDHGPSGSALMLWGPDKSMMLIRTDSRSGCTVEARLRGPAPVTIAELMVPHQLLSTAQHTSTK